MIDFMVIHPLNLQTPFILLAFFVPVFHIQVMICYKCLKIFDYFKKK